ncbi:DUF4232 domain-containing protein [Streptomyces oryzae]|uniref:DUF4232 domain-containing protein n=1 Tax=Streptomyces oryzae TaxID=1434886 RepID=A0ABS3XFL3_9ACTN|nr:DUF4232 domain-containing protein [Streptomyces oryzae]MBO8194178.1 DUF4232 domain-containing protein [Streptomyces oryzae]
MARTEGTTTAESAAGAAVAAAHRAPARGSSGRPARIAVAAAAALAAGSLLAGCGGKDNDASGKSGERTASAGSSHTEKHDDGGTSGGSTDGGTSGGSGSGGSTSGGTKSSGSAAKSGKTGGSTAEARSSAAHSAGTSGSACTAGDLKGSIGPNHPGAGQENFAVVLTNKSGHTCTVRGFPGFAFLNSDGEQVSLDPQRDSSGTETHTVKLSPGKSAWAPLSYTNPEMTNVPTVTPHSALITPPDRRTSLRVDWSGGPVSATGKASVPKIGPLSAGTGS